MMLIINKATNYGNGSDVRDIDNEYSISEVKLYQWWLVITDTGINNSIFIDIR